MDDEQNLEQIARDLAEIEAKKNIKFGLIWILIGAVLSIGSYFYVDIGETYFIFWGLILYGAYRLWKGLFLD